MNRNGLSTRKHYHLIAKHIPTGRLTKLHECTVGQFEAKLLDYSDTDQFEVFAVRRDYMGPHVPFMFDTCWDYPTFMGMATKYTVN